MAMRISKKVCNEAAEVIGATFYGRNELTCDGKVHVRFEGKRHTFKTNGDAFDWMMEVMNGKVDELAKELGF